ncbi:hypothetical protein [Polaribacter sp.]|uniref:hypothetical protein n=2 Tax=Polaribacter sp. TaxID=1920175 RepID=UPI004048C3BD
MKKGILIVLGFLTLNTFSQSNLLSDKSADKNRIKDFIQTSIKEQKISENPVIVLDEKVISFNDLNTFSLSDEEIVSISIVSKEQAILDVLYGEQSKNGVIMIVTKQYQKTLDELASKENDHENVLYLLDGKKITKKELSKIETNKIKSVNVIKKPSEIAKYTADSYDGVIVIDLKK